MIAIQTNSLKQLNKKLKGIAREYKRWSPRKPKEIYDILFTHGNNMRNYIITEMRNTVRAPWSYKKTKSGKRHHPSMPGNYPAIDTGEGIRSVAANTQMKSGGIRLEIGANTGAPYLKFLEEGTERMDARPWLEPTVNKFQEDIIRDLENVIPDNVVGFMVRGAQ